MVPTNPLLPSWPLSEQILGPWVARVWGNDVAGITSRVLACSHRTTGPSRRRGLRTRLRLKGEFFVPPSREPLDRTRPGTQSWQPRSAEERRARRGANEKCRLRPNRDVTKMPAPERAAPPVRPNRGAGHISTITGRGRYNESPKSQWALHDITSPYRVTSPDRQSEAPDMRPSDLSTRCPLRALPHHRSGWPSLLVCILLEALVEVSETLGNACTRVGAELKGSGPCFLRTWPTARAT
jgi:hypothetical protein